MTNLWLGGRSGTVVVARDYAAGLAERGWRVAIYAPNDVEGAADLAPGVEALNSLGDAIDRPDLIHGHQHPALFAAMARFPEASAVQLIHDSVGWHDQALRLERVRRYAAVDLACRDRVAHDTDLEAGDVTVLPNALDLRRCLPRRALPKRARRVLVVANRVGTHVATVERACTAAGLEVDSIGWGVGKGSDQLEAAMAEADIVVGAARIALEAMAVGCAALVCDYRGLAGMAHPDTFDDWRANNFGLRLLQQAVTLEAVGEALTSYNAAAAAEVSARVRAECGLDPALDRLEAFYRAALDDHAAALPVDRDREARAFGAYMQAWLPTNLATSPFVAEATFHANAARTAQARLAAVIQELGRRGIKIEFNGPPLKGG